MTERIIQINTPDSPIGAEALAEQIYEAAAQLAALMEREGMQDNYDVTYNSLREIASFGKQHEAA